MTTALETRVAVREHVLDRDGLGDHLDRLFRAAWALSGSYHDAEDLVQDTYAGVLARERVVKHSDDLGYLLRALRNTFISKRRALLARPQTVEAELEDLSLLDPRSGGDPQTAAETSEVFAAIAALPPFFRDALVAVDVVGLTYADAAKALHVRTGTITSRVARARTQVARSLSPHGAYSS
jgi:RNA polymerase sigma-70 factor (ECF subfamily)